MCIDQFLAGCISKHLSAWENLISDPDVQTARHMKFELRENPSQFSIGYEIPSGQKSLIQEELIRKVAVVNKLLRKRAVVPCYHEHGEFIPRLSKRKK